QKAAGEPLDRDAPDETVDRFLERGVPLDECLDLGDGMEHGGVVLASERTPNLAEGRVRELPRQVHGNLTREGHGASPIVAADVCELDAEELRGLGLDVVDGRESVFLAPESAEDFMREAERQRSTAERLESEQARQAPFDLPDV